MDLSKTRLPHHRVLLQRLGLSKHHRPRHFAQFVNRTRHHHVQNLGDNTYVQQIRGAHRTDLWAEQDKSKCKHVDQQKCCPDLGI